MMKNILTIISLFALLLVASCEKNVITYNTTDLDLNKRGEVRLVYDLPLLTSTTQNVTRMKYNDAIVSEVSTALGSIFPNSIAKYHALPLGSNKVELFISSTKDQLLYTGTFNLSKGKWSAFVYNANQPPLLVQDPEEYQTGHPWNDTVAYIRFVNLFHKPDGVTPYGKLYLKGRRPSATPGVTYDYIDIASAGYMEASDYMPYKLNRQGIAIWSGTETSMVFALFNQSGQMLTYWASSTAKTKTDYTATGFSLTKGVNYIFHINGKEGDNYAGQAIRLSTISVN